MVQFDVSQNKDRLINLGQYLLFRACPALDAEPPKLGLGLGVIAIYPGRVT